MCSRAAGGERFRRYGTQRGACTQHALYSGSSARRGSAGTAVGGGRMPPVKEGVERVVRSPVFVDATGRRRSWVTWAVGAAAVVCFGYVLLLGFSFAGGPIKPGDLLPLPGLGRAQKPAGDSTPAEAPGGSPTPGGTAGAPGGAGAASGSAGAPGGSGAPVRSGAPGAGGPGSPTTSPTRPGAAGTGGSGTARSSPRGATTTAPRPRASPPAPGAGAAPPAPGASLPAAPPPGPAP